LDEFLSCLRLESDFMWRDFHARRGRRQTIRAMI
jgi:hypothetical protein